MPPSLSESPGLSQIHALKELGRFNDPSAIPVVLQAAIEQDKEISNAAIMAIAKIESDKVEMAIADMLDSDDPRILEVAATLAGSLALTSTAPALFELANDSETPYHFAAIQALGSTATLEDLPKLIEKALDSQTADLQKISLAALTSACARLPREESAKQLILAMDNAPKQGKVILLEQLKTIGGGAALQAVVAAVHSSDDVLQDAATRLLGNWTTADAAPELFDLASGKLGSDRYQIRVLRGYIRIARQLNMTSAGRLEICKNALALAKRDKERRLVVETLGRIASPDALTLVDAQLEVEAIQETACSAIVAMSKHLAQQIPEEIKKSLKRVIHLSKNGEVRLEAEQQLAALENADQ